MRSSEYWKHRMKELTQRQEQADEVLQSNIKRQYDALMHDLDRELSAFYARYAANEAITMAEARKLLSDVELDNFKISLEEFRDKAIAGGWDRQLNEVYLRSRVSRLQALQTQIAVRVEELYQSQQEALTSHLKAACADTYYRTVYEVQKGVGFATTFAKLDAAVVERIISRPWLEDSFSGRIWKNRNLLSRELETTLSQAFVRGDPLQRTASLLAKRMDVSKSRAMTLVATESAHLAAQATAKGYAETGVEQYDFLAALDLKTCDICAPLDGKTFKRTEAQTGINYPPMHPRCRCTTVPHFDDDFGIVSTRAARDPVTGKSIKVPGDMTYAQWHQQYVETVPAANTRERMLHNLSQDKEQFSKYRAIFGEKMPRTIDDFQKMKYNNPKEWNEMKKQKQGLLNTKKFSEIKPLHGRLSNLETRLWYKAQDAQIPLALDRKKPLKAQARKAYGLRNLHRRQAQQLMADTKTRAMLESRPVLTFNELLEHKRLKYGLTGDAAYEDIIRSSGTTNKLYDKKAGIE